MKDKGFEIAVIGSGAAGRTVTEMLHISRDNVVVMAEEKKDKAVLVLGQEKKYTIKAPPPAVYEWRPPLSRAERRKQERKNKK